MQTILPPLSAFKLLKDSMKSSRPGKLSIPVRVNEVEHRCLLLRISSKDPVQSRINSLDNWITPLDSYRLLLLKTTLASYRPVCFSNLPPNSSKSSQCLWARVKRVAIYFLSAYSTFGTWFILSSKDWTVLLLSTNYLEDQCCHLKGVPANTKHTISCTLTGFT